MLKITFQELQFWKLRKRKPGTIKMAGKIPVSVRGMMVMVNGFMCTTLPMKNKKSLRS